MRTHHITLLALDRHVGHDAWESQEALRIGSRSDLEIVLNDTSISPEHADVRCTEQHGWVVRDLGSAHGTYVNGARVGPAVRRLHLHDVIRCGNMSLCVSELQGPHVRGSGILVRIEAVARRPWEQAIDLLAHDEAKRPHQVRHLLTLLRAGYHLQSLECPDQLMQAILDDVTKVLEAQRGSIVLADPVSGELELRAVALHGRAATAQRFFSRSLARRCFDRGESFLCRNVKAEIPQQDAHSLVGQNMSSIICAVLRSPRRRLGVLHLDRSSVQAPFNEADLLLADAIAASVSAGIESAALVVAQRNLFISTATALAQAAELRDPHTGDHTRRVTDYALLLARELQFARSDQQHLELGAPLHDIGKIGIEDRILLKEGPLTREEFEHMKTHTTKGAAILERVPALAPIVPIIRSHHERWDGGGYPDGLAGEAISPLARVVAVADAFDAMTSDRPYRAALPRETAYTELHHQAGAHFDPHIVQAFLRMRTAIDAEEG